MRQPPLTPVRSQSSSATRNAGPCERERTKTARHAYASSCPLWRVMLMAAVFGPAGAGTAQATSHCNTLLV